jgi:hypothetical protein
MPAASTTRVGAGAMELSPEGIIGGERMSERAFVTGNKLADKTARRFVPI